jgi:hypothetical protein
MRAAVSSIAFAVTSAIDQKDKNNIKRHPYGLFLK